MFDGLRIVATLTGHGIDFVVIGGFAARVHGSPVVTDDLDIVIAAEPDNKTALAGALVELGARRRIGGDEYAFTGFRGDDEVLYRFVTDAGNLDVVTYPLGGHYGLLRESAQIVDVDGVRFPVAGLDMLIAMKRLADRPKDRLMLAWLLETREAAEGER
ncbi:MAG: hypothetical protein IT198_08260 [Acidimicrobiia bacterium]|nr:hypothetical protein [Acidimicrobiia bacterium]